MKKTARKSIKKYILKKTIKLTLFVLNKRTEVKEHQDFIQPLLEGKTWG
jgi:16S rRNA (cytidine1402-2'-O)-methyltransferase